MDVRPSPWALAAPAVCAPCDGYGRKMMLRSASIGMADATTNPTGSPTLPTEEHVLRCLG
eukprot:1159827-Pelagomonas_calceolata.AAC.21